MDPVRADRPYQTIATDDIGAFVALAFERPAEFIGKELEMAGSELTNPEAAKVFSRDLGKPVKFQKLPLLHFRLVAGELSRSPGALGALQSKYQGFAFGVCPLSERGKRTLNPTTL